MKKVQFNNLTCLIDDIDSAFELFYKTMLQDQRLSIFFESEQQIIQLIQKQRGYFRNSLKQPIEEVKTSYIKLGELHYDLRIPYVDFIKGTKILEEHFLIYANEKKSSSETISEIFEYFKLMTSFTAKGYLNKMLIEDKRDIDNFFQQSLEINTFLPKAIIIKKFEWLKSIIECIENNNTSGFNFETNMFEEWLKDVELLSLEKRAFFEDLEKRISINIQNLFYFLHKEEYLEILPLYTSLLSIYKLILMVNNTLTIKYANQMIEQLKLDTLTNLFRKDMFDEILEKEIAFTKREQGNYIFSIAYIDLDDFKSVNDTYGHYSGDKVIERMGEAIRDNIRTSDFGFRIGGDEFAILFKDATKKEAQKVCKKIKFDFSNFKFMFNDTTIFHVGLSIGIIEFSSTSHKNVTALKECVDKKLYEAKHKGKNTICL